MVRRRNTEPDAQQTEETVEAEQEQGQEQEQEIETVAIRPTRRGRRRSSAHTVDNSSSESA